MAKAKTDRDEVAAMRSIIGKTVDFMKERYGKKAQVEIGSIDLVGVSEWASTGSVALDRAISRSLNPGEGGIPLGPRRGRIVHLFGDPSTGKSVVLDHIFKSAQAANGLTHVMETEGTREPHFANAIGLDLSRLIVSRPPTIEVMIDMIVDWANESIRQVKSARIKRQIPLVVGIDSLEVVEAGRTFGVKMSGKEGGAHQYGGGRAGAISAGFRKLAYLCNTYPLNIILLNQVKENIGVAFGERRKPGGGSAPKFYASVEIRLGSSRLGIGSTSRFVHAKVIKNKVAAPFGTAHLLIDFNTGLDQWAGLLETFEDEKLVTLKRNKDGSLASDEFTFNKTGECVKLEDFVSWAEENAAFLGNPEQLQAESDGETPDDLEK